MCGGKRKTCGGVTRLFHNLRVNPHNKHMIFLWWAAGAAALLALTMAAIVPAGVVVQAYFDVKRACGALTVSAAGIKLVRIKAFECGGRIYLQINQREPFAAQDKIKRREDHETGKQKKGKKSLEKVGKESKGLKLRRLYVNASVGTGEAAGTAALTGAAENAFALLDKKVDASKKAFAVLPVFGESAFAINVRVHIGWVALISALAEMRRRAKA